jgi:hypothetical protein
MKLLLLFIAMLFVPLLAMPADEELLLRVMECESGLRYNVWGDDRKSFGIAQFRKETFYEFAAMARPEMKIAGLWPPVWQNPQHQVFLLEWGIDNGYGKRWTCYRMLTEGKL